ncbi:MAG: BglG family transcription antiterminator [Clostridia bacterium]
MDVNSRLKKVVLIMLENGKPMSVSQLAKEIGVSKRTIQRDLEYLPKILKKYNLEFASKTGVGIWINGEENSKYELIKTIENENTDDMSDKDYRRKMLTLELLKEKGLKKLYWYSSKFQVSEGTISLDLEFLEDWFNKFGLKIIKKPGSGILVDGSEENYRKAIRSFITENMDSQFISYAYSEKSENVELFNKLKKTGIAQMLNEDVLKRVVTTFNNMNSSRINKLTQSAYWGLIMHVGIAIGRILNNETIQNYEKWSEDFNGDDDYVFAENLAYELEDEFEIQIPKIEVAYICLHIKASKQEKIDENLQEKFKIDAENLYNLINEMIYSFDFEKAYLLKQDEEFLKGLLAHLKPTLVRLNYNMKIDNPVLSEIKTQYPEVFEKCIKVAKVIENYTLQKIPEEEIGFLAVHFGAALVRIEAKSETLRTVNIAVVCSSGIGISRLMSSKIKKIFKERVNLITYGKNEINQSIADKVDFIISTIHQTWDFIETINVNPLLSEKDIEQILDLIVKYEKTSGKNLEQNEIDADFDDIEFLVKQIKIVMKEFSLEYLPENINFNDALNQISSIVAEDNKEVIINAINEREKLSSQIFPEFGFALLHARIQGIDNPCLKIFVSNDFTGFNHSDFNGIKIIFTMLIPKDENLEKNSVILSCVSSSIVEDDFLIDTILTHDIEKIRKQLGKIFKDFLKNYIQKLGN